MLKEEILKQNYGKFRCLVDKKEYNQKKKTCEKSGMFYKNTC